MNDALFLKISLWPTAYVMFVSPAYQISNIRFQYAQHAAAADTCSSLIAWVSRSRYPCNNTGRHLSTFLTHSAAVEPNALDTTGFIANRIMLDPTARLGVQPYRLSRHSMKKSAITVSDEVRKSESWKKATRHRISSWGEGGRNRATDLPRPRYRCRISASSTKEETASTRFRQHAVVLVRIVFRCHSHASSPDALRPS